MTQPKKPTLKETPHAKLFKNASPGLKKLADQYRAARRERLRQEYKDRKSVDFN